jgi:hypothetical protein
VRTYEVVPLALASKDRKYDNTKCEFTYKNIEHEFPIDQEVLLTHPDEALCGSKAKVVGYTEKGENVKIEITHPLKKLTRQKLLKIVNTDEVFLDLRFVSEIIGNSSFYIRLQV